MYPEPAARESRLARFILLLLAGLVPTAFGAALPHAARGAEPREVALKADLVVVEKVQRTLYLLRGGEILRSYRIALGRNPVGPKTREGDSRTPEGVYRLDWRNPESRFYRSIHISYPNETDRRRAAERNVPPGGDIMIHGQPPGSPASPAAQIPWDWTDGCIAVTNDEIDEIWALVDNGTPIEIRP
jgi:murein L,D-transpeptidase YafK